MIRKKHVKIVTSRFGGPYTAGKALAEILNKKSKKFKASLAHTAADILSTPFEDDCHLVHTNPPLFFHKGKKPILLNIRGFYKDENFVYRVFFDIAKHTCKAICTPTNFMKKKLRLGKNEKKCYVIPNAIDCKQYKPVKHKIKKEFHFVTVMNFCFKDKAEGVMKLLYVLSSLKTNKTIVYHVVGDGKFLKKIKKEKFPLPKNIKVKLYGRRKDVKKFLEQADMFLYWSEKDNFPNVILEAMACGLPVITNDWGAAAEIIEDMKDGFIVHNMKGYKRILELLIRDYKQRDKIGRAARVSCEEKFSWHILYKEWEKLYEKII